MSSNSDKTKNQSSSDLTNIGYKSIKTIFYAMIVLNGLLAVFFNPLSARVLLRVEAELGKGTQFGLSLTCLFFILMILLYAYNIFLWNSGHRTIPAIVANISVTLLAIGLFLLVVECVFRFFFSDRLVKNIYSYNKTFGMNYTKPNLNVRFITSEYDVCFRTNSIGLRGMRELIEKGKNEKRVLITGDSIIQAAQVDEKNTMASKLEEMLNSNIQSNIWFRVINASMSGWTPSDEREFLEKNWGLFKPDYVLLSVYVGNDVIETMLKNGGHRLRPSSRGFFERIDTFLRSSVNPITVVRFFAERLKAKRDWPMGRPNQPFYDPHFRNGEGNVFRKDYSDEIKDAYEVIKVEILRIRNICGSNGSQLCLLIVPTKEQIDESKLQETVKFLKLDMNQLDLGKPQQIIKEFAIRNDIKIIDLLDALKDTGRIQPVYYDIDSHWNTLGNLCVAREVFTYLNGIRVQKR